MVGIVRQPQLYFFDALEFDAIERHGIDPDSSGQSEAFERQEDIEYRLIGIGVDVLLEQLDAAGLAVLHHSRCNTIDHERRIACEVADALLIVDDNAVAIGFHLIAALDRQASHDLRNIEGLRLDKGKRRRVDHYRRRLDQLLVGLQASGFVGDFEVLDHNQHLRGKAESKEPEAAERDLLVYLDIGSEVIGRQ